MNYADGCTLHAHAHTRVARINDEGGKKRDARRARTVKFALNANPREQQVQEKKKETVRKVATRGRYSFRKVHRRTPERKEREDKRARNQNG